MTLMRRESRSPLRSLMDYLAEDWRPFEPWQPFAGMPSAPSIDMRETDDAYIVEAEMPGIKPEGVDVTLEGRTLVVRGTFGEERSEEQEGGRWLIRERRRGSYSRSISLPSGVDADNISASFENGELAVTIPKAKEDKARHIPIGDGQRQAATSARQVGG